MPGKGGSRSGGGGSRSSGGTGVVHVSGYTRANGTYVAGYTRSSPSSAGGSRSSSASTPSRASSYSSSTGRTVNVSGYTRSDGTHVAGYTRAAPGTSTSACGSVSSRSSSTSAASPTVSVSGFTRSDGRYVQGYTRSLPGTKSSSSMPSVSESSNETVPVRSYTKADGTVVSAHTRSKPTPGQSRCTSQDSATSTTPRYYKDNAYNRKLGRVGMRIGTCVVSSKESVETSSASTSAVVVPVHLYVDNPKNQRLGRAGKPIPPRRSQKIREAIEDNTIEELRELLEQLLRNPPKPYCFYEEQAYALQLMHHQEVEEKWEAMDVEPSTDVSRLSQLHVQGQIIPLEELHLDKQEIGRGGFGVVYAGLWHGTPIAFKKLHYQHVSKRHLESFTAEVSVLAAVHHPNTVRMFGVVVEAGNIGIVMEYMTQSLFHAIFIKCTEFSEMEKKRIVYQMTSAVKYLHTHDPNIAHCDIKSENVLLDRDSNVKLTDFGLSTMKNTSESSQSNFGAGAAPGKGTPRYSAPEVLRGEILKTDKLLPTDIYSLSLVVYEVVAEEEPFEGLSIKQLEVNVGSRNLRPLPPDTLSKPLVDLLKRSWEADPPKRPTAAEFESSWRDISSLYAK